MHAFLLLVSAALLAGAAHGSDSPTPTTLDTTTSSAYTPICVDPRPSAASTSVWSPAYPTFTAPCNPRTLVPDNSNVGLVGAREPTPGDWTVGYMATCRNCSLAPSDPRDNSDTKVVCMCLNGHPECQESMNRAVYVKSELNLNGHFGNRDGYLTFGMNNFLYTCEDCSLSCGHWYLCQCHYADGKHYSVVNLDLYFWAPYGVLQRRPLEYLPPPPVVPSINAADPDGMGYPAAPPDHPDNSWKPKYVLRSASGESAAAMDVASKLTTPPMLAAHTHTPGSWPTSRTSITRSEYSANLALTGYTSYIRTAVPSKVSHASQAAPDVYLLRKHKLRHGNKDSFSMACHSCHMGPREFAAEKNDGPLLACFCLDPVVKKLSMTTINLDRHIGNDNGQLVWNSSGYQASCSNFGLARGHLYTASCLDRHQQVTRAYIDLEEHIKLCAGLLVAANAACA